MDSNMLEAKTAILNFVEAWFTKEAKNMADTPEYYTECTPEDFTLWFWESGGEL